MRARDRLVLLSVLCLITSYLVFNKARDATLLRGAGGEHANERMNWQDIPNVEKNRTQIGKENAVLYMLVRNFEVHQALESIRQIEDRFNRRYRYPWVFLNDELFTDEFKRLTSGMVSGSVEYGFIPAEVWDTPPHIDLDFYEERLQYMEENDVIYGGSKSYRNMCRFNSGNFFWHPLMMKYDYYWRVEPSIQLYCDQRYDPFEFLRINDLLYGFVVTLVEYKETIPTFYRTFLEFANQNPNLIHPDNALEFATHFDDIDDAYSQERASKFNSDGYNTCHFWSNFEIANLNFFRSKEYTAYFNHLDKSGGFYYERWGDAPVHTLGVLALMNKSQIHFFNDIGYYHPPFFHCPSDSESFDSGRCLCPIDSEKIDNGWYSCLPAWLDMFGNKMVYNAPTMQLFE